MATVNLLPNADVSNDWTLSTGSDVFALLRDDYTGNSSLDSNHIRATTSGKSCQVAFGDFTEAHSSIDSVQAVAKAGNNGRGQSFALDMSILNSSGTFWGAEGSGTQLASALYRTITFTSRTTSDGSSAWTNADVNDLRMRVDLSAHSGGTTRFTYCYFIITYTEPTVTDNAVFFGTNF